MFKNNVKLMLKVGVSSKTNKRYYTLVANYGNDEVGYEEMVLSFDIRAIADICGVSTNDIKALAIGIYNI